MTICLVGMLLRYLGHGKLTAFSRSHMMAGYWRKPRRSSFSSCWIRKSQPFFFENEFDFVAAEAGR